jgi:hypothetical protein
MVMVLVIYGAQSSRRLNYLKIFCLEWQYLREISLYWGSNNDDLEPHALIVSQSLLAAISLEPFGEDIGH